jgi:transposase
MRQAHPASERMFVDYAGQTVKLIDGRSGEISQAQVFFAVMGASSYTFAEARWTQTLLTCQIFKKDGQSANEE